MIFLVLMNVVTWVWLYLLWTNLVEKTDHDRRHVKSAVEMYRDQLRNYIGTVHADIVHKMDLGNNTVITFLNNSYNKLKPFDKGKKPKQNK